MVENNVKSGGESKKDEEDIYSNLGHSVRDFSQRIETKYVTNIIQKEEHQTYCTLLNINVRPEHIGIIKGESTRVFFCIMIPFKICYKGFMTLQYHH